MSLSDFQNLNIGRPYKEQACLAKQKLGHTYLAHVLECVIIMTTIIIIISIQDLCKGLWHLCCHS